MTFITKLKTVYFPPRPFWSVVMLPFSLPNFFETVRPCTRVSALLAIAIGINSCGSSKVAQCKKLILITQKISEDSAQYRESTEEAEVLKVADKFDATAKKVSQLKLDDPTLQGYQQELLAIYQGNAEATRNMIAALNSKDILTAQLAQKQVKTIGSQEQQVITNINRHCQTP